jgi:metal-responsive CopG/Arc/MetJ family transcriptional regulator
MKNVQISFDEELLHELDRHAASSNLSRSAIIRDAVKSWLRERQIKIFEDEWIRRIREKPDEAEDAEAWLKAQYWSE